MQNNDYISREAAIKAITELMSSPWATEGTPMYSIGIKEALSLVRDMIRGNVPKGMQIPAADVRPVVRWIPVEERLPEINTPVLCACRAGIFEILHLHDDGLWADTDMWEFRLGYVTHWMPLPGMPLPEPPEKRGEIK